MGNTQLMMATIPCLLSQFTPSLQKPEGFRVKASEGEVVVFYFEPSATQNLKFSGFPGGYTTWQNRRHPWNSPEEISRKWHYYYDIVYNNNSLSILCHIVYATMGFMLSRDKLEISLVTLWLTGEGRFLARIRVKPVVM